tara:strand:- start:124 stop:519 length:396 start_codon:yes stop_codon:yes gene_type:complete
MKNPIQKNEMCATPKEFDEVWAVVNRIPDSERKWAMIAVTMAVNFCSRLADIELMPWVRSAMGQTAEQQKAHRLIMSDRITIAEALERGICGDFAKGLGKSLIHADSGNLHLITKTWPDIIIKAHRLAVDK